MFRYARILMAVSCLVWVVGCDNQTTTPPAVSVSVSPTTASVDTSLTQQITATVTNASNTAVSWSVNGVAGGNATVGTISATGLYTAPAVPPVPATVTVTATSAADSTKSASTTVTLTNIQVSVSPATANVGLGLTQQFTATVTGSTTTTVTWSVNGIAGGDATVGTIDATGLYTAPAVVPSPDDTVTIAAASTVNTSKTGSGDATIAAGPVIAGTVSKGRLNGAAVKAYAVAANGTNGTLLSSGLTDGSGNFSIALPAPQTGPVRVVASGGSYKSEASGTTVTGTSDVSSLVDSVPANVTGVAVTPLSTFVSSLTVHRLSGGGSLRRGRAVVAVGSPATEHAAANSAVAAFFGLSGGAAIETLHPKFGKSDITDDEDGFKVGLALGTLSLQGANLLPSSPDDLVGALAADLTDGEFDGHDDTGAPVPLGGGDLPPTAGTTDFLTSLNDYIETGDAILAAGIVPGDVSGEVGDISGGVTTSDLTPPAVGLSAGSSGAVSSMSFGGRQYVFIAARSNGVAVIDVTDPALPTVKLWPSVYTNIFGSYEVGGVIPVLGTATHPQVLSFAYGSKHVALLNAQILATGTPGVDDGSLVDFQGDLPLVATSPVGFSGGSAFIAGGIPDNGRKGVWLATADGYAFFDLLTNSLTTLYPCAPLGCDGTDPSNMLAENLGGDIGHNLLLAGNYIGVQLIDLLAAKSYAGDTGVLTTYPNIDGDSVDSGLQVGIFTYEDTNNAGFLNLATIIKTDGVDGAPNTFVPGTDGFVDVTFATGTFLEFSGSAVDSSSHLALFMAGFSADIAVGQLQDPAAVPIGETWKGLTDWSFFTLYNSPALADYNYAYDPHAVGVVFSINANKPYGYLLDACTDPATYIDYYCRAIQIDLTGFLALPRAGAPGSGDAAYTPAGDPFTAGTITVIPFVP